MKRGRKLRNFKKSNRDYRQDLDYKEWRLKIRRRDGSKCQFPMCMEKHGKVICHHIKRWADWPTLRYEPSNGICLCPKHHKEVTGKEVYYEPMFIMIVCQNQINYDKKKKKTPKPHLKKENIYGEDNGDS